MRRTIAYVKITNNSILASWRLVCFYFMCRGSWAGRPCHFNLKNGDWRRFYCHVRNNTRLVKNLEVPILKSRRTYLFLKRHIK
jgi:hypothetical protein